MRRKIVIFLLAIQVAAMSILCSCQNRQEQGTNSSDGEIVEKNPKYNYNEDVYEDFDPYDEGTAD